jgi:hypothetical protein
MVVRNPDQYVFPRVMHRTAQANGLSSSNEEDDPLINNEQIIPALAFMTLGIVIAFAIFQFFSIMRKRRQRQQTPLTRASEEKRARQGSVIGE